MFSRLPPTTTRFRRKEKRRIKEIGKKHPEYELTAAMMLGIRTTVGNAESKAPRPLRPEDMYVSTKLRFPSAGSMLTPAHSMRDFKFKDYAPEVFRHIRERFGINPADYLLTVCGSFRYLEFISNSKSGQFFFYTHDRKFMIKTISQGEARFLRQILPAYYDVSWPSLHLSFTASRTQSRPSPVLPYTADALCAFPSPDPIPGSGR